MAKKSEENKFGFDDETPGWLKSIQLNSWEAELLISALFLYILFQIPDYLDNYRKINFSSGDVFYVLIGVFKDALRVLSIGYVIHIVARGIWVANIGLSYVFPRGIDLKKIPLKGKFKEEVEKDTTLDQSVLRLERISSMVYAISFMCSGLLLSFGMVLLTLLVYIEWVLNPSIESGVGWQYGIALVGLLLYVLIILIVFIDFLSNGYFRRDSSISRPYYYIALFFRYLTLSFIYNRVLLTILSNLTKWQSRLLPFIIIAFLIGFKWIGNEIEDKKKEDYYQGSFENMRFENFENLRTSDNKLFVTIQSDIIDEGVIKLFINSLDEMGNIHDNDPKRFKSWRALAPSVRSDFVKQYIQVKLDSMVLDDKQWHGYKHPVSLRPGFLCYLDISSFQTGSHTLHVVLDTAAMLDEQRIYLRESESDHLVQARIPFYLVK